MMRKTCLAALVGSLFWLPQIATAQSDALPGYAAADRNGDEKIDQNEMVSHVVIIFRSSR